MLPELWVSRAGDGGALLLPSTSTSTSASAAGATVSALSQSAAVCVSSAAPGVEVYPSANSGAVMLVRLPAPSFVQCVQVTLLDAELLMAAAAAAAAAAVSSLSASASASSSSSASSAAPASTAPAAPAAAAAAAAAGAGGWSGALPAASMITGRERAGSQPPPAPPPSPTALHAAASLSTPVPPMTLAGSSLAQCVVSAVSVVDVRGGERAGSAATPVGPTPLQGGVLLWLAPCNAVCTSIRIQWSGVPADALRRALVSIAGLCLDHVPAPEHLMPLLNAVRDVERAGAPAERVFVLRMCGMALMSARRFTQAVEMLRGAGELARAQPGWCSSAFWHPLAVSTELLAADALSVHRFLAAKLHSYVRAGTTWACGGAGGSTRAASMHVQRGASAADEALLSNAHEFASLCIDEVVDSVRVKLDVIVPMLLDALHSRLKPVVHAALGGLEVLLGQLACSLGDHFVALVRALFDGFPMSSAAVTPPSSEGVATTATSVRASSANGTTGSAPGAAAALTQLARPFFGTRSDDALEAGGIGAALVGESVATDAQGDDADDVLRAHFTRVLESCCDLVAHMSTAMARSLFTNAVEPLLIGVAGRASLPTGADGHGVHGAGLAFDARGAHVRAVLLLRMLMVISVRASGSVPLTAATLRAMLDLSLSRPSASASDTESALSGGGRAALSSDVQQRGAGAPRLGLAKAESPSSPNGAVTLGAAANGGASGASGPPSAWEAVQNAASRALDFVVLRCLGQPRDSQAAELGRWSFTELRECGLLTMSLGHGPAADVAVARLRVVLRVLTGYAEMWARDAGADTQAFVDSFPALIRMLDDPSIRGDLPCYRDVWACVLRLADVSPAFARPDVVCLALPLVNACARRAESSSLSILELSLLECALTGIASHAERGAAFVGLLMALCQWVPHNLHDTTFNVLALLLRLCRHDLRSAHLHTVLAALLDPFTVKSAARHRCVGALVDVLVGGRDAAPASSGLVRAAAASSSPARLPATGGDSAHAERVGSSTPQRSDTFSALRAALDICVLGNVWPRPAQSADAKQQQLLYDMLEERLAFFSLVLARLDRPRRDAPSVGTGASATASELADGSAAELLSMGDFALAACLRLLDSPSRAARMHALSIALWFLSRSRGTHHEMRALRTVLVRAFSFDSHADLQLRMVGFCVELCESSTFERLQTLVDSVTEAATALICSPWRAVASASVRLVEVCAQRALLLWRATDAPAAATFVALVGSLASVLEEMVALCGRDPAVEQAALVLIGCVLRSTSQSAPRELDDVIVRMCAACGWTRESAVRRASPALDAAGAVVLPTSGAPGQRHQRTSSVTSSASDLRSSSATPVDVADGAAPPNAARRPRRSSATIGGSAATAAVAAATAAAAAASSGGAGVGVPGSAVGRVAPLPAPTSLWEIPEAEQRVLWSVLETIDEAVAPSSGHELRAAAGGDVGTTDDDISFDDLGIVDVGDDEVDADAEQDAAAAVLASGGGPVGRYGGAVRSAAALRAAAPISSVELARAPLQHVTLPQRNLVRVPSPHTVRWVQDVGVLRAPVVPEPVYQHTSRAGGDGDLLDDAVGSGDVPDEGEPIVEAVASAGEDEWRPSANAGASEHAGEGASRETFRAEYRPPAWRAGPGTQRWMGTRQRPLSPGASARAAAMAGLSWPSSATSAASSGSSVSASLGGQWSDIGDADSGNESEFSFEDQSMASQSSELRSGVASAAGSLAASTVANIRASAGSGGSGGGVVRAAAQRRGGGAAGGAGGSRHAANASLSLSVSSEAMLGGSARRGTMSPQPLLHGQVLRQRARDTHGVGGTRPLVAVSSTNRRRPMSAVIPSSPDRSRSSHYWSLTRPLTAGSHSIDPGRAGTGADRRASPARTLDDAASGARGATVHFATHAYVVPEREDSDEPSAAHGVPVASSSGAAAFAESMGVGGTAVPASDAVSSTAPALAVVARSDSATAAPAAGNDSTTSSEGSGQDDVLLAADDDTSASGTDSSWSALAHAHESGDVVAGVGVGTPASVLSPGGSPAASARRRPKSAPAAPGVSVTPQSGARSGGSAHASTPADGVRAGPAALLDEGDSALELSPSSGVQAAALSASMPAVSGDPAPASASSSSSSSSSSSDASASRAGSLSAAGARPRFTQHAARSVDQPAAPPSDVQIGPDGMARVGAPVARVLSAADEQDTPRSVNAEERSLGFAQASDMDRSRSFSDDFLASPAKQVGPLGASPQAVADRATAAATSADVGEWNGELGALVSDEIELVFSDT